MKPTTIQAIDERPLVKNRGSKMSMPRRAMQEMGFQSCCLLCDARDVAGTKRCRTCIEKHSLTRKNIEERPSDDLVGQFARELFQMISAPHRWDHDTVHGPELERIQYLAGLVSAPKKMPTTEEISELFATQAKKVKRSLIQDVANRNPWKEAPPSAEEAWLFGENLPVIEDLVPGARTIPNRPIPKVDRSDRVGEDRALVDVLASQEAKDEAVIEQRETAREDWSKALDSVGGILDGSDEVPDKEENVEDDLDL